MPLGHWYRRAERVHGPAWGLGRGGRDLDKWAGQERAKTEDEWERPAVEEAVALQKLDSRVVVAWRLNQAVAAQWGEA